MNYCSQLLSVEFTNCTIRYIGHITRSLSQFNGSNYIVGVCEHKWHTENENSGEKWQTHRKWKITLMWTINVNGYFIAQIRLVVLFSSNVLNFWSPHKMWILYYSDYEYLSVRDCCPTIIFWSSFQSKLKIVKIQVQNVYSTGCCGTSTWIDIPLQVKICLNSKNALKYFLTLKRRMSFNFP